MQWLNTIATGTARLQQIAGAHLFLSREGGRRVYYVVLRKKNHQLFLVEKGELPWEQFLGQHNKNIPITLSVDGKGILTKALQAADEVALEEVLPGANETEFYYNRLAGAPAHWISLTRKTVAEEIMQEVTQAGLSLFDLQLGPLSITALLPLLRDNANIQLPHWQLQHVDGELRTLTPQAGTEEFFYSLGDEKFSGAYLHPYANAFSGMLKLDVYADTNIKQIQLLWLQKRLYKKLGVGLLVFFFSLLLCNFSLFTYLSASQQELDGRLQQHRHLLTQLEQMEKQEEDRNRLLATMPLRKQPLFAYYADLLGASVPPGVQLDQLLLHPEEPRKNKREALRFMHGFVEVHGHCTNPLVLNKWLEQLEKAPWVAGIKGQRYGSSAVGRESGSFSFTLTITAP
jgi:hypothetical protein